MGESKSVQAIPINTERPWNTQAPFCRDVFCAALQGIISNRAFFGATMQQDPRAAVAFADAVVLQAAYGRTVDWTTLIRNETTAP